MSVQQPDGAELDGRGCRERESEQRECARCKRVCCAVPYTVATPPNVAHARKLAFTDRRTRSNGSKNTRSIAPNDDRGI